MELPTFGRLGHLTAEQETALNQFKKELEADGYYKPQQHDNHLLLRFLRARKFQLPAAKKMFEDCENWRKDFGTNDVIDKFEFPEYPIVKQYYPRFYHKVDKLGRPLYIEQLGSLDVKKLFTVTNADKMMQNHVYEYERLVHYRLMACSTKKGEYLEQSCTILDLKGVSLSGFSSVYSFVKQVSSIAQDYYPEMLGKMFIINAPMLFTAVWGMVKPLLDEATVKKIDILGSSYKAKLLELISEDDLPEFLGGKCKCAEGCDKSDIGPWNDGSVPGYPNPKYERLNIHFGMGQGPKIQ